MENKNIVMLKHSPLNLPFTNVSYTNQVDKLSDYEVIDVTSRVTRNKEFMKNHPTFAADLSPFYIGPVISSDGVKCNIFEIFWQCGKVYPCHDDHNHPTKDYFKWRNSFYEKEVCSKDLMRHSCHDLGYENRDALYFAYFDKEKNDYVALDYVASRKKVYFKEYAKLVYNTESFKYLQSIVDSGKKLALVDFDGFNFYSENVKTKLYESKLKKCKENHTVMTQTLDDYLNIKTLKDVVNCPFLPCGHGNAIKALLQKDIEVINGEVVDHVGLLD